MKIHKKLSSVRKPGRYIGSELHAILKKRRTKCRFCLAFPDLYEIGMSHMGMQLLYSLINSLNHVHCERVFAPAKDYAELLQKEGKALTTLESKKPLHQCDIIGFSLQYELSYTNILTILSLGKIAFRSTERTTNDPLIIAGGPCSVNPEVLAPFVDVFLIGDGEDVLPELIRLFLKNKKSGKKTSRLDFYKSIAHLPGIYIPSLYTAECDDKAGVTALTPNASFTPQTIQKAYIKDYENSHYPSKPIIPFIKAIHERACVEIMRGCPHSCKFCQARHYYYPVRKRSKARVKELALRILESTGYEELSLLSLSSGDYPEIRELFEDLLEDLKAKNISLSLPSLRVEKLIESLPYYISRFKKSGLTFAPEAGSERLRKFIGKNITISYLEDAARAAYKNGYKHLKLYFMIGLPTETYDDLDQMISLIYKIANIRREFSRKPGQVNVGIGTFIPKPHTPFERETMNSQEEIEEKQRYLARELRKKYIKYSFTPFHVSALESALTRGDRQISSVLQTAWELGARLDAWTEEFQFEAWEKAFAKHNISIIEYATRPFPSESRLAWSHIALR